MPTALTATIIELRRQAQQAAHGQVQAALRLVEVEVRRERALQDAIAAAEAALCRAQSGGGGAPVPALLLEQAAAAARAQHQALQRLRAELRATQRRAAELLQRARADRGLLLQCVQRREAAESYEAREERERQRTRSRRAAANDDELASQKHSARLRRPHDP